MDEISVNFLTQKLTLVAADDKFDAVLNAVIEKARQIEPDTIITV